MTDKQTLIDEILATQHQLQRAFAEDRSNPLFHSQLTMSQLKLLLVIHHSGGAGGQELARAMGISLATLTGIIDRMVGQGLVTRREDPHDRRVRRIELTEHGGRLIDGIITTGTQRMRGLLESIDRDGLEVIRDGLALLDRAVREAAGTGPCPAGTPTATATGAPAGTADGPATVGG